MDYPTLVIGDSPRQTSALSAGGLVLISGATSGQARMRDIDWDATLASLNPMKIIKFGHEHSPDQRIEALDGHHRAEAMTGAEPGAEALRGKTEEECADLKNGYVAAKQWESFRYLLIDSTPDDALVTVISAPRAAGVISVSQRA
jgi:hypothetical protein